MLRLTALVPCLIASLACAACFHHGPPPESQAAPYETFDEDNYSNLSSYGSGSEVGEGYYGVGNALSPPERTPAAPRAGGHQPY
jgi:hypothetical protein